MRGVRQRGLERREGWYVLLVDLNDDWDYEVGIPSHGAPMRYVASSADDSVAVSGGPLTSARQGRTFLPGSSGS